MKGFCKVTAYHVAAIQCPKGVMYFLFLFCFVLISHFLSVCNYSIILYFIDLIFLVQRCVVRIVQHLCTKMY